MKVYVGYRITCPTSFLEISLLNIDFHIVAVLD